MQFQNIFFIDGRREDEKQKQMNKYVKRAYKFRCGL